MKKLKKINLKKLGITFNIKDKKLKDLLIWLGATVLFSLLVCAIDRKPIGPNGTVVGFSIINGLFHNLIGTNMACYYLTNILGYVAILVCLGFAALGAYQLYKGRSLAKVDRNIIALGVLYAIVIVLYVVFEKAEINFRPILMGNETSPEASFPSSHTMLALVVFCSIPYGVKNYIKDAGSLQSIKITSYILAIITVAGRLVSGVHWFTDIVAGVLISISLLKIFAYIFPMIQPKQKDAE